jgi:hypothetical protein
MAGINFMSYIDGQRLAEQDNIRDEDRWRKQAAEDRAMQYADRDQAYKEQVQGYSLDEYAAKSADRADSTEIKEANRSVGDAYSMYTAAANAQGKKVWEVMLESQPFVLEGASPRKQALFDAGMREVVGTKIVHDMRVQGLYKEAGQLEERFGLAVNKSTKFMEQQKMLSDPAYADEALTKNGYTPNPDGTWSLGGVPMSRAVAIGTVVQPEASLLTLINQEKQNRLDAERVKVSGQVAVSSAQSIDAADNKLVTKHILDGLPKDALPSHLQYKYDQLATALKKPTTGAGSPPIPSASDIGTYTAAPAAATAPIAPAAIKNVAGPLSDWRNAIPPSDSLGMTDKSPVATAPKTMDEINHRSTSELSAIRYAITTGQRIPGLSPAAMGAYLKVINEEIASRHAAEAKQLSRSSK